VDVGACKHASQHIVQACLLNLGGVSYMDMCAATTVAMPTKREQSIHTKQPHRCNGIGCGALIGGLGTDAVFNMSATIQDLDRIDCWLRSCAHLSQAA
jgi:hypothetical protein